MKKYLKNKFIEQYKSEPELYLSCGGRFEVLGNHTDHNHGLVHLFSEGFTETTIDLSSLDKTLKKKVSQAL